MKTVSQKIKMPVPMVRSFLAWENGYTHNSNDIISPFRAYVGSNLCKGDVIYPQVEAAVRTLLDLGSPEHSCSVSDGERTCKGNLNNKQYEIRCVTATTYFGPSSSTGKGREPATNSSNEVWLSHDKDVKAKIDYIDYYIMVDIMYPPYWFIYEIPSIAIQSLYESGKLVRKTIDMGGNKFKIIKNKVTRKQFWEYFLGTRDDNPFRLDGGHSSANIYDISTEETEEAIKMLGYRTEEIPWHKIKKNDTKLSKNPNSIDKMEQGESLAEQLGTILI